MAVRRRKAEPKSDSDLALREKACYYRRFSGVTF